MNCLNEKVFEWKRHAKHFFWTRPKISLSQMSDVSRAGFELAQDLGFTSFKCGDAVAATAKPTLLLSRRSIQSMEPG